MEIGVAEIAGLGSLLIGCIAALWRVIINYRTKEEARHEKTVEQLDELHEQNTNTKAELEATKVKLSFIDGQVAFANNIAAQVEETNVVAKDILHAVKQQGALK